MSAIMRPKDRDASDKGDGVRSPKPTDSPEISRRDERRTTDRGDKDPKDKKERTKALGTKTKRAASFSSFLSGRSSDYHADDLAPPVAPKASPTAGVTGVHHSRTHTAPAMARPSTGGSMLARPTQSLSSSDGAPRTLPITPASESGDRRRLTMSGVGSSSRASVSGSSRDEDKPKDKPRARDDEVFKEGHRERTGSFGAADVQRRPKLVASPTPTSPTTGINDLQIVKQPKPYQDPRLSSPGVTGSPESKALSPTSNVKASTSSTRVSVSGDRDRTDLKESMKEKSSKDREGREKDRERDKDKEDSRTKTKADKKELSDLDVRSPKDKTTRDKDLIDSEARPKRTDKEKDKTDRDRDREKERDKDSPDPDARPKRTDKERELPDPDARPSKPKDIGETTDLRASTSGGSRIARAANPGSQSAGSRGSRIGGAPSDRITQPTADPQPSVNPLSASTPAISPLTASASSPPAVTTPVAPLSTSPSSPPTAIATGTSPQKPPSITPPTAPASTAAPPPVNADKLNLLSASSKTATKDDISVGDRLKLLMNISPRASQSMVQMNSAQLQALRDKHKANANPKATEPMDLKDVMLKMRDPNYGLELKETKISFFTSKKCMTGQAFVDWIIAQKLTESGSRAEAVAIATALLNTGNIELVKAVNEKEKEGIFSDSLSLYTITKTEDEKKKDKASKEKNDMLSPRGTSPRRRWFGSTLPDIMSSQEPGEKVPRVVTTLLAAVRTMNGARTEGIFRISPEGSLIENLKEQLERGNLNVTGHDPHVPACCFKLFLRELRQPVIPDALYDECIKAAESPTAAEAVIAKLPETNKNLVTTLVHFLVDLAAPENVVITKMPVSNLAVVFAPCLLRCPLQNPLDIMRNSSVEQMFVQTLIEAHCPPSYIKGIVPVSRTIVVPLKGDGDSAQLNSIKSSSGKRYDFTAAGAAGADGDAKSGSGKQLDLPGIPQSDSSGKIGDRRSQEAPRRDTGSGKKMEVVTAGAETPGPSSPSIASPTTPAEAKGSSLSGKNIGEVRKISDSPVVVVSAPSSSSLSTDAQAAANSTESKSQGSGSGKNVPTIVPKSEPVPIPTGGTAPSVSISPSLSSSAPLSSSVASQSPSTADQFSAPTSPLVPPEGGTSPQQTSSPDTQQAAAAVTVSAAPAEDTDVAQLLKSADPAVAARLGPQLREVKLRLAAAEAGGDVELSGFYRAQVDALRRQLGGSAAT